MKMTEEARKTPDDKLQNPESETRLFVYFGFDGRLSGKLPFSITEPSIGIDVQSRSWVLYCFQSAWFLELGTDEEYKHVTTFLRAFSFEICTTQRLLIKTISVISIRHDVGLQNCSYSE